MKQATIESRIRMVHQWLADARHIDDIKDLTRLLQDLIMMKPDDKKDEEES